MLVNTFNKYKEGTSFKAIEAEIKKISDYTYKNSKRKIKPFNDFISGTWDIKDEIVNEMKHLTSREKYVNESNNAQKVLKKLKASDLPEAEGFDDKNSQVGSFLSADNITALYGDDFEGIIDNMGDEGMLVYYWGGMHCLWQKKKDDDGYEGLVRIV